MEPSSRKVAHRWLMRQAGVFDPPPEMVKQIGSWVLAQVAANEVAANEGRIKELKGERQRLEASPPVRKLRTAVRTLQDALPRGKSRELASAYKAFWEASLGVWGYGIPELKMKTFTGLKDPAKRRQMEQLVERSLKQAEDRLDAMLSQAEQGGIPKLRQEIKEYRPYLQSGVKAMTSDTVEKDFPVDLEGWKHGGQTLVEEATQRELEGMRKVLEQVDPSSDVASFIKERVEKGLGAWSTVRVSLTTDMSVKAAAYWQPARKLVVIEVPRSAHPKTFQRSLLASLSHELRHMGQSLLASVKGVGDEYMTKRVPGPGLPSRKVMTPQYKQDPSDGPRRRYDPSKPSQGQSHALDDVEFYTELPDAIDRIRPLLKGTLGERKALFGRLTGGRVPTEYKELVRYTSIDPFFRALQKFARGKWKKAVSEAYKVLLR